MTLQDKMIEYRAKERISQAELARRAGVSLQTIGSVEQGSQTPSRVTRAKIELIVGKAQDETVSK